MSIDENHRLNEGTLRHQIWRSCFESRLLEYAWGVDFLEALHWYCTFGRSKVCGSRHGKCEHTLDENDSLPGLTREL